MRTQRVEFHESVRQRREWAVHPRKRGARVKCDAQNVAFTLKYAGEAAPARARETRLASPRDIIPLKDEVRRWKRQNMLLVRLGQ